MPSFLVFKRPIARIFWAKELKSKNISGLKMMPYRDYKNDTIQTLNTQTGLNDTRHVQNITIQN